MRNSRVLKFFILEVTPTTGGTVVLSTVTGTTRQVTLSGTTRLCQFLIYFMSMGQSRLMAKLTATKPIGAWDTLNRLVG